MDDDKEKYRILLEENRILMNELRELQTKYVRLKLFKEDISQEKDYNYELDKKVDIIIRYFLTGIPEYKNFENDKLLNDEEDGKFEISMLQNEYAVLNEKLKKYSLEEFKNYIDSLKIKSQKKAVILTEFSINLKQEDIKNAAQMAWFAWLYDPQPCRMKYLAFLMADANELFLADVLLNMLSDSEPFSEREKRKKEIIHKRIQSRIEYAKENENQEKTNVSSLRSKIMRLNYENEKINDDKKNLLYLMKIKDEYLEKINKNYDEFEKYMKNMSLSK